VTLKKKRSAATELLMVGGCTPPLNSHRHLRFDQQYLLGELLDRRQRIADLAGC
jgi:hypothetical protein